MSDRDDQEEVGDDAALGRPSNGSKRANVDQPSVQTDDKSSNDDQSESENDADSVEAERSSEDESVQSPHAEEDMSDRDGQEGLQNEELNLPDNAPQDNESTSSDNNSGGEEDTADSNGKNAQLEEGDGLQSEELNLPDNAPQDNESTTRFWTPLVLDRYKWDVCTLEDQRMQSYNATGSSSTPRQLPNPSISVSNALEERHREWCKQDSVGFGYEGTQSASARGFPCLPWTHP
ncbi:dentin sialophosphoprotein-like [Neocloeon triangulifer]|uniref:dentin sialophosphoprotein-like n=1 Tax=Neocloeon triangulifer TaxID=2078957 RepID=UPI00286EE8BC|nr:dentin sialophosphoprotein-like [Neocloeon triangulifer]